MKQYIQSKPITKKVLSQAARDNIPPLLPIPASAESYLKENKPVLSKCPENILWPWARCICWMVYDMHRKHPCLHQLISNNRNVYIGEINKLYPTYHSSYRKERLAPGRPPKSNFMDIAVGLELWLRDKYDFRGIPLLELIYIVVKLFVPANNMDFEIFKRSRQSLLARHRSLWDKINRTQDHYLIRRSLIEKVYQLQHDYPLTALIWVADKD